MKTKRTVSIGKTEALNLLLRHIIPGEHDAMLDEFPRFGPRGGFKGFKHDNKICWRNSDRWIGNAVRMGGVRHGRCFFERDDEAIEAMKCSCILPKHPMLLSLIKEIRRDDVFKRVKKLLAAGHAEAAIVAMRLSK